ncbi:MAG TPA: DEAD/DEAH box helicase [Chiayiivirga sp.]|nr:DEAD/DEAH box helicase [Chiayiivirga sp.]
MTTSSSVAAGFAALSLSAPILQALVDVGYEAPSPIQAATIPPLLEGRDLVGQAQTGTGKTAAFALPILERIDATQPRTQALVLAPTRELAIQVAEAFQTYAAHIPGFQVLPIYGGQGYGAQLHGLKRGAHVVVATPGRLIDHIERGSIDLSQLKVMVLDEADEMLRMGFIDDVESILKKTPETRQTALFSATMPPAIRRIAQTYLREPVDVSIAAKTRTATNIRQRYCLVQANQKLDAITRVLEVEPVDGMIVFTRTKQATEELADRLQARGFATAAINGDIPQPLRERAVQKLKDGQLDILVATDVAARGLDVERISHVLNYDIPYDVDSYVHRIGRTGRAGRAGEAILFVTARERGMLRTIERVTRQPIESMAIPSSGQVNDQRIERFKNKIDQALSAEGAQLDLFRSLIADYEREHDASLLDVAAALAHLLQGGSPLLLEPDPVVRHERDRHERPQRESRPERGERPHRHEHHEERERPARRHQADAGFDSTAARGPGRTPAREEGFETYRIAVGRVHQVKPGNIVGAIANEAGLESRYIGRIDIRDDHSYVDLPPGMPPELLQHLQTVWVAGQRLKLQRHEGEIPLAPRIRRPFSDDGFEGDRGTRAPRPRSGFAHGDDRPQGRQSAHDRGDSGHQPRAKGAPARPGSHASDAPGRKGFFRNSAPERDGSSAPRKGGFKQGPGFGKPGGKKRPERD